MRTGKREQSLNTQAELILGQRLRGARTIAPRYQEALESWVYHPWNWMAAKDPQTDEPLIWTKDERDKVVPVKSFPEREYLFWIVDTLHRERLVVIQKTRQMYISTIVCLYMLWQCLFIDARRWLLSKVTEDDAREMLRDKVRFPYSRLPQWFRDTYPASKSPEARMDFESTDSYIEAVAENVADREARGGTGGVFVDEAAFQREYQNIWASSLPMAAQVIAVSTPCASNPGARFMKRQVEDDFNE